MHKPKWIFNIRHTHTQNREQVERMEIYIRALAALNTCTRECWKRNRNKQIKRAKSRHPTQKQDILYTHTRDTRIPQKQFKLPPFVGGGDFELFK